MTPTETINRGRKYPDGFNHYDEGWNAFVDGKPMVGASRSWKAGWWDAREVGATEKMK